MAEKDKSDQSSVIGAFDSSILVEKFGKKKLIAKLADVLEVGEGTSEDFQQRVLDLTGKSSKLIRGEIFPIWSKIVYDENPIHLDEEKAKAFEAVKFETTPVYGTLIAAHGGQYVSKLLDEINLVRSSPLIYTKQIIKFKDPLYPGEHLVWGLKRVSRGEDGGLELSVTGTTLKGKEVAEFTTVALGSKREEFSKQDMRSHFYNSILSHKTEINHDDLKKYHFCLGEQESGRVPMEFAQALVPAALLQLSLEKTGKYDGAYRSVEFVFYNEPSLGGFKTSVINQSEPKYGRGNYLHNFGILCQQEDKDILRAKARCTLTEKVD